MKKNDWILIAAVLLIAGIGLVAFYKAGIQGNGYVTVKIGGETEGRYSLSENQTVDIQQTNTLVIKDGKADMVDAVCPDKVCVYQKAISKKHESIICLPNKVIVEVTEGQEGELDAVAN